MKKVNTDHHRDGSAMKSEGELETKAGVDAWIFDEASVADSIDQQKGSVLGVQSIRDVENRSGQAESITDPIVTQQIKRGEAGRRKFRQRVRHDILPMNHSCQNGDPPAILLVIEEADADRAVERIDTWQRLGVLVGITNQRPWVVIDTSHVRDGANVATPSRSRISAYASPP